MYISLQTENFKSHNFAKSYILFYVINIFIMNIVV